MDNQMWRCSCGSENYEMFCPACGRKRDGNNEQSVTDINNAFYQAMEVQKALKEQQLEQQREEQRKKFIFDNAVNDYKSKCAEVSIKHLKSWGSSWIVLLLSILVSISMIFTLVSAFTTLNVGFIASIKNFLNVVLSVLVCVGFWLVFFHNKKSNGPLNVSGIKILRGVVTFKMIMMHIGMAFITIITIIFFALLALIGGAINSAVDEQFQGVTISFTSILVIVLLVIIVYWVIQGLYYASIKNFARESIRSFSTGVVTVNQTYTDAYGRLRRTKNTKVAIFFFIIGGISLIGSILKLTVFASVHSVLNEVASEENGEITNFFLRSVSSLFNLDTFALVAGFVNAFTYILGGVLAVQFNRMNDKISEEIASIPQPTMN